jgi:hypothetical protein
MKTGASMNFPADLVQVGGGIIAFGGVVLFGITYYKAGPGLFEQFWARLVLAAPYFFVAVGGGLVALIGELAEYIGDLGDDVRKKLHVMTDPLPNSRSQEEAAKTLAGILEKVGKLEDTASRLSGQLSCVADTDSQEQISELVTVHPGQAARARRQQFCSGRSDGAGARSKPAATACVT